MNWDLVQSTVSVRIRVCKYTGWKYITAMQKCKNKMQGQIVLDIFCGYSQGGECLSSLSDALRLNSVLPHHPWHNTAMGSILLLPMCLASQACCLEQEPCHLVFYLRTIYHSRAVSDLSPRYYCNPNMK